MADINDYALNLALNIDATAAIGQLDTVSEQIDQINTDIQTLSTTINTDLAQAAQTLSDSMQQVNTHITAINTGAATLGDNLTLTTTPSTEMLEAQQQISIALGQVVERLQEMIDYLATIVIDTGDISENIAMMRDHVDEVNESWWDFTKKTAKSALALGGVLFSMNAIRAAFHALNEESAQFQYASFRSQGSMDEMLTKVNRAAVEYGVLKTEATEAGKILGQIMRVPGRDLEKYIGMTAQFSHVTGVSADATANWARKMRLAGFGVQATERVLAKMTYAMEQAGLTTEQMQSLMAEQTEKAGVRMFIWGRKNMEMVQDYQNRMVAFAGQTKGNVGAMQELTSTLLDNAVAQNILASRGAKFHSQLEGLTGAERKLTAIQLGLMDVMNEMSGQLGDIDIHSESGALQMLNMAEAYSAQVGVTKELLAETYAWADANKLVGEGAVNDFNKFKSAQDSVLKNYDQQNKLNEMYGKSMLNMGKRIEEILNKITIAWQSLIIRIKPYIMALLDVIEPLIDAVLKFIDPMIAIAPPAEAAADAVGKVAEAAGPLTAIVKPAEATAEAVSKVADAAEGTSGAVKGTTNALKGFDITFGGVIKTLLGIGVVYAVIKVGIILLGQFMKVLSPAKLLALAAAVASVGLSVLMVAIAFKMIADLGASALIPLLIMVVVFGALAVAIIALTYTAAASVPVMTTLSGLLLSAAAVMLALGAAVVMVGYGFKLLASSFVTMASLGWAIIGPLVALIVVLGGLTVAAYLLAPVGWIVVGVLLSIAAAALAVGAATIMVGVGFKMMGAAIVSVAEAGWGAIAALVAMTVAIIALGIAGYYMAPALVVVAGVLLAIGAAALLAGAGIALMGVGFTLIASSLATISEHGSGAATAIGEVMVALAKLGAMGALLGIGLIAVTTSLLSLAGAAIAAGIGMVLIGAGLWLVGAAIKMMGDAGPNATNTLLAIAGAIAVLGGASVAYAPGILVLTVALLGLSVAAILIGVAAVAFGFGLKLIAGAIDSMAGVSVAQLEEISLGLLTFLGTVIAASVMLIAAASLMMLGSVGIGLAFTAFSVSLWLISLSRLSAVAESFDMLSKSLDSLTNVNYTRLKGVGGAVRTFAADINKSRKEITAAVSELDTLSNAGTGVMNLADALYDINEISISDASVNIVDGIKSLVTGLKNINTALDRKSIEKAIGNLVKIVHSVSGKLILGFESMLNTKSFIENVFEEISKTIKEGVTKISDETSKIDEAMAPVTELPAATSTPSEASAGLALPEGVEMPGEIPSTQVFDQESPNTWRQGRENSTATRQQTAVLGEIVEILGELRDKNRDVEILEALTNVKRSGRRNRIGSGGAKGGGEPDGG